MSDDEGGLESCFGLFNLMGPFLSPEIFEGKESVSYFVVVLHVLLVVLLLDEVGRELFHGT